MKNSITFDSRSRRRVDDKVTLFGIVGGSGLQTLDIGAMADLSLGVASHDFLGHEFGYPGGYLLVCAEILDGGDRHEIGN